MTTSLAIHFARYRDGQPFSLDIVTEGNLAYVDVGRGYQKPSRRERFDIYARNRQEALATVDYHFGVRVLWFKLDDPAAPREPK